MPAPSENSRLATSTSTYGVAVWVSIATLFLLHTIRMMHDLIHPDVAWYLYGTGQLLHGAKLYHDIVDIDPPLIYILTTPPVWLAGVLGVPATAVYKAFMVILAGIIVLICSRIMRVVLYGLSETTQRVLLVLLSFLFVSLAGGNFWYWGASFGQREHLVILLTMPYMLAAIGRAEGNELPRGSRLMLSALAAIGIAIKPHCVLMWCMVEAYLALICHEKRIWSRIENLTIASLLLAYWTIVVLFVPEFLALALNVVRVDGAYNVSLWILLTQGAVLLWILAIAMAWFVRTNPVNVHARLLMVVAGTAFLIAALLQRKGGGFQFYPARAALLASIGVSIDAVLERGGVVPMKMWFNKTRLKGIMVLVLLIVAAKPAVDSLTRPLPGAFPSLLPLTKKYAGGMRIMVFSTTIEPQFPLVEYAGVRWSSRYPDLWFLPGLYADVVPASDGVYPYRRPSQMGSVERGFFEDVVHDLLASQPELILNNVAVERYPLGRTTFNFADYYSMDPRFLELWKQYRRIDTIGGFDIYKRQPAELSLASNH